MMRHGDDASTTTITAAVGSPFVVNHVRHHDVINPLQRQQPRDHPHPNRRSSSSVSLLLRNVAQINDDAVRRMQHGRFPRAISYLGYAMKLLQRRHHHENDDDDDMTVAVMPSSSSVPSSFSSCCSTSHHHDELPLNDVNVTDHVPSCHEDDDENSDGGVRCGCHCGRQRIPRPQREDGGNHDCAAVFHREAVMVVAVMLEPPMRSDTDDIPIYRNAFSLSSSSSSFCDDTIMAAVVVYHCGLSYHLLGYDETGRELLWRSANSFYRRSIELLLSSSNENISYHRMAHVIVAACAHNISCLQCYFRIGHPDRYVRELFQQAVEAIMASSSSSSIDDVDDDDDDDDWEFFRGTMFLTEAMETTMSSQPAPCA